MLPELSSLLALKLNSKRFFHFNSTTFYYSIKGCNYKATPILLKNNSVYVTTPNNNHLHSTFQRIIHDKKKRIDRVCSWKFRRGTISSRTPTATFPFFLALNGRERLLAVVHRASSLLVTMTYFDDHYKRLNTTGRGKDGRHFWVHSRRRIETHVMEEEKYRTTATENGHVMLRQEGS